MLNTYPIFESGQVLTSKHLNELASYLEGQDRHTRNKLIGIGIVCGLEVDYPADGNLLHIGAGVAVTSEGYLIVLDNCLLGQYRSYTLPTPEFEEIPEDLSLLGESQYPFFLDADGNQIQLWELFEEGYAPAPGEPVLTALDAVFLSNKVVLLFLECVQNSLKSCELNDCSDKGAEQTFIVRKLLVQKADAQAIFDMEEEIAGRPVDLSQHPKYELPPLQIEKLNPAGNGLNSLADLFFRVLEILLASGPQIVTNFDRGYHAYAYLLKDIYPEADYPDGPFAGTGMWLNALNELVQNVYLFQYFYDLLYDLTQSHNEFLTEAAKLEAQCCPNAARFPKHVLLGIAADRPTAFAPPTQVTPLDPLSLDTGFGAAVKPARFRHHFIFSPLFDRHHESLQRVRSLHYRTFLLAWRYQTDGLSKKAIRITPSRDGNATLSEKAIPFYYAFNKKDDLHRNWSFDATIRNWLDLVYAYPTTTKADHPLLRRLEGQNFYRVEGIVGQSLGEAMRQLITQKKALGLSFAIEPVYVGLGVTGDLSTLALDRQVQERLRQAIFKVLICRFRDLDVIFLILMMTLFFFLFVIIALLSGLTARAVGMVPKGAIRSKGTRPTLAAIAAAAEPLFLRPEALKAGISVEKNQADTLLFEIRQRTYTKGWVTEKVRPPKGEEDSIGIAYEKILKGGGRDENLYDRTLKYAKELNLDARVEEVADNLYKTVSLIDKSEELIGVVGAGSIGTMDFDRFQKSYSAFEGAYDEYLEHAATADASNSPEIAAAEEILILNRGQMEAGGSVTLINSMMKEFQTRMASNFGELILAGYADRHPGMEHQCGVPKGGTLILLHTHQNLIRQVLAQNRNQIDEKMETVYGTFGIKGVEPKIKDPREALEERRSTADPLDDFVVLGDFCIPYLCCDTDCSDILLKENPSAVTRPGIVAGRIFGMRAGRRGTAPAALDKAVISVTHAGTNETVAVEAVGEAFSFSAAAGVYRIEVKKRGYVPTERLIRVPEGGDLLENFVLDRPEG